MKESEQNSLETMVVAWHNEDPNPFSIPASPTFVMEYDANLNSGLVDVASCNYF